MTVPDIGLMGEEDLVLRPDIGLVDGLCLRELGFGLNVGLCVASVELNWGY